MNCPFCSEIATGLPPARVPPNLQSRIVFTSRHFVVVIDISPLVVGHVLVLPKSHTLSVGALSGAERHELVEVVDRICEKLGVINAKGVIALEHGSDSSADGGACVSHAHLHLLPTGPLGMDEALASYRLASVDGYDDLVRWAELDKPYVFIGEPSGAGLVADHLAGIPKQFLRIELARRLAIPDPLWDWRKHLLAENLLRTAEQLGVGH